MRKNISKFTYKETKKLNILIVKRVRVSINITLHDKIYIFGLNHTFRDCQFLCKRQKIIIPSITSLLFTERSARRLKFSSLDAKPFLFYIKTIYDSFIFLPQIVTYMTLMATLLCTCFLDLLFKFT